MQQAGFFDPVRFVGETEPEFAASGFRSCKTDLREPTRILIIHDGGAGDFVLLSPCLREIKRIYPDAEIILAVPPRSYDLATACPYVSDNLVHEMLQPTWDYGQHIFGYTLDFVRGLLPLRLDIAFNFGVYFPAALLSYMSGARERITYASQNTWEACNKGISYQISQTLMSVPPPKISQSPHVADSYLAVIDNLLHTPIQNRALEVWCEEADVEFARSTLGNDANRQLIALCMGGLGGRKSWPPENYAALAEKILTCDGTAFFMLIGGESERAAGEVFEKNLPPRNVLNLIGKLNFRQTIACMSFCRAYIGNDTSCMHIAAALGLPVLAVFCYPADLPVEGGLLDMYFPYHVPAVVLQPSHTLPECRGDALPSARVFGCVQGYPHCITQVTVEEMWQGWQKLQDICHI